MSSQTSTSLRRATCPEGPKRPLLVVRRDPALTIEPGLGSARARAALSLHGALSDRRKLPSRSSNETRSPTKGERPDVDRDRLIGRNRLCGGTWCLAGGQGKSALRRGSRTVSSATFREELGAAAAALPDSTLFDAPAGFQSIPFFPDRTIARVRLNRRNRCRWTHSPGNSPHSAQSFFLALTRPLYT